MGPVLQIYKLLEFGFQAESGTEVMNIKEISYCMNISSLHRGHTKGSSSAVSPTHSHISKSVLLTDGTKPTFCSGYFFLSTS